MQSYVLPQTQKILDDLTAQMPDYFQSLFNNVDWQGELVRIGLKYGLNDEQNRAFITETAMVMFGINQPVVYIQMIENYTGVSQSIAENIALEVSDRVFGMLQQIMTEEHRDEIEFMQAEVSRLRQEEGQESSFKDLGIELGVLEAGDVILDDSQVPVPENNEMYNQLMNQRAPLTEVDTRGVRSADGMTQRVAHAAGLAQNQPPLAPVDVLQDAMIAQQASAQMPIDRSLENEVDNLFGAIDKQQMPILDTQEQWQDVVPKKYEVKDPYHEIIDETDPDDPAANWH